MILRFLLFLILLDPLFTQRFQSGQKTLSSSEELAFQQTAFLSRGEKLIFKQSDSEFTLFTYTDKSNRQYLIPEENNYYTTDFSTILTSALVLKPKNESVVIKFENNTNFKFLIETIDPIMVPESVSVKLTDSNSMYFHAMFGYDGLTMMNIQNFNLQNNQFFFLFGMPTTGTTIEFDKKADFSSAFSVPNPDHSTDHLFFFSPFFESQKLVGNVEFHLHFRNQELKPFEFKNALDSSMSFDTQVERSTGLYLASKKMIEDYIKSKDYDELIPPLENPNHIIYSLNNNSPKGVSSTKSSEISVNIGEF